MWRLLFLKRTFDFGKEDEILLDFLEKRTATGDFMKMKRITWDFHEEEDMICPM